MKKTISLCVMSLILLLLGCTDLPDGTPSRELSYENVSDLNDESTNHTDVENGTSNYTFISLHADYPEYDNIESVSNAATNIYIGTVKDISYEIIDMKTGKVDNSAESQSSSRMLYTIYTVSVTTSLKGENPSEIKIRRIGGLIGCNETDQYEKMEKSGLLSKYNGIPIVDKSVTLNVDDEYIFCTQRTGGDFDFVINLTQFAYKVNSYEAELLIENNK